MIQREELEEQLAGTHKIKVKGGVYKRFWECCACGQRCDPALPKVILSSFSPPPRRCWLTHSYFSQRLTTVGVKYPTGRCPRPQCAGETFRKAEMVRATKAVAPRKSSWSEGTASSSGASGSAQITVIRVTLLVALIVALYLGIRFFFFCCFFSQPPPVPVWLQLALLGVRGNAAGVVERPRRCGRGAPRPVSSPDPCLDCLHDLLSAAKRLRGAGTPNDLAHRVSTQCEIRVLEKADGRSLRLLDVLCSRHSGDINDKLNATSSRYASSTRVRKKKKRTGCMLSTQLTLAPGLSFVSEVRGPVRAARNPQAMAPGGLLGRVLGRLLRRLPISFIVNEPPSLRRQMAPRVASRLRYLLYVAAVASGTTTRTFGTASSWTRLTCRKPPRRSSSSPLRTSRVRGGVLHRTEGLPAGGVLTWRRPTSSRGRGGGWR